MVKDKYRTYLNWGVTIFLIIVCSIFAFFLLYRWNEMCELFQKVGDILSPIMTGVVVAYLLNPVMDTLIRWFNRIPGKSGTLRKRLTRGAAIMLSLLLLLAILGFMIGMIIPQLVDTLRTMISNVGVYIAAVEEWMTPLMEMNPDIHNTVTGIIEQAESTIRSFFRNDIGRLVGTLTSGVMGVGRFIYNFVIGLIVSVYLLAAKEKLVGRMKKLLFAFVRTPQANKILGVARQTNRMFKGFIVGKILDSSIIGVLCFVGMTLLKLPYTLLISVIIGVTNIIPYFGPFIGAIPSALLILIESPIKCLIFVIFIFVLQQVDGNFIGPKVLGNTTGLSSLGVLFSILVGGGLFGLVGMLVCVPVCGVLYSLIKALADGKLKKRGLPSESTGYTHVTGVDEETKRLKM
ncbi:MAG: AI-2E family transporter [Candidatus Excrementavichristensenella sp.]|jgi:predicted PurR-regulated permease PerM